MPGFVFGRILHLLRIRIREAQLRTAVLPVLWRLSKAIQLVYALFM